MSVEAAVLGLLSIIVVCNLTLTVGIVRHLRGRNVSGAASFRPAPGFSVDLERDAPWPSQAANMLSGDALVIFSLPGCSGCDRARRDLAARTPDGVDVYLVLDRPLSEDEWREYVASWPGNPCALLAPHSIDTLNSFDRPLEFPTVVLMRDGAVVASGNSLADVDRLLPRARPLTRTSTPA